MQDPQSDTFEIRVPLTLGGELVFGNDYPTASRATTVVGSGTLVLSSSVRFTDGTAVSDVPTAASNRITMVVGKIRPTVTNALDGVALAFGADSSGIELDRSVSADMREYGFFAVKDGSSLTAEGKIQVSIAGVSPDDGDFEQAVCTVATGESQRIRGSLVLQKIRGFAGKLTCVDRDDGTTTIKAEYERVGLVLILR